MGIASSLSCTVDFWGSGAVCGLLTLVPTPMPLEIAKVCLVEGLNLQKTRPFYCSPFHMISIFYIFNFIDVLNC